MRQILLTSVEAKELLDLATGVNEITGVLREGLEKDLECLDKATDKFYTDMSNSLSKLNQCVVEIIENNTTKNTRFKFFKGGPKVLIDVPVVVQEVEEILNGIDFDSTVKVIADYRYIEDVILGLPLERCLTCNVKNIHNPEVMEHNTVTIYLGNNTSLFICICSIANKGDYIKSKLTELKEDDISDIVKLLQKFLYLNIGTLSVDIDVVSKIKTVSQKYNNQEMEN